MPKKYPPERYIKCHDCDKILIKSGNNPKRPRRCMACFTKWRLANPTFTKVYKGGITKGPFGYVVVMAKDHPDAVNGYIRQHRLVASQMLGRRLEKSEVVHHINGIKTDNRPENLVVCKTNAEHIKRFHPAKKCKVEGCGKPNKALGLCQRHYQRLKHYGRLVNRKGEVL